MLDPNTFKCGSCGECCKTYTVRLDSSDIVRIRKLGHAEDFFVEYDKYVSGNVMKKDRATNWCIFLEKSLGKPFCRIYSSRPEVCREYPFVSGKVESCKPVTFLKPR